MKTKYDRQVILTTATRSKLIYELTKLLKLGICRISVSWGDDDPLTQEVFNFHELYERGYAIKIDEPGPYRGDALDLIRIPHHAPDDGRFFSEGAEFFFNKKNKYEIRTKQPIQQYSTEKGLIRTFAIMKIKLIVKYPYNKTAKNLLEEIKNDEEFSWAEESSLW